MLPCWLVVLTFALADAFFDPQVCPKYARVPYSATRNVGAGNHGAVLLAHILLSENIGLFSSKG